MLHRHLMGLKSNIKSGVETIYSYYFFKARSILVYNVAVEEGRFRANKASNKMAMIKRGYDSPTAFWQPSAQTALLTICHFLTPITAKVEPRIYLKPIQIQSLENFWIFYLFHKTFFQEA